MKSFDLKRLRPYLSLPSHPTTIFFKKSFFYGMTFEWHAHLKGIQMDQYKLIDDFANSLLIELSFG